MAETYSQSVTGINAGARYNTPQTIKVGDSACQSIGDEQKSMMTGTQILCKNPDGSQSWYTIDAERSIPGVQRIMRAV